MLEVKGPLNDLGFTSPYHLIAFHLIAVFETGWPVAK